MASTDAAAPRWFGHVYRDLLHQSTERRSIRGIFLGCSRLFDLGTIYSVQRQPIFATLSHALRSDAGDAVSEDWRVAGDDLWQGLSVFAHSLPDDDRDAVLTLFIHGLADTRLGAMGDHSDEAQPRLPFGEEADLGD